MTQKQKILLYLHSNASMEASWIVINEDNSILESIVRNDVSKLEQSKNQALIVIVPGEDILLTQAELPKLSHHRLQQALPFAVEDQLIDDITQLHFATGKYQSQRFWPIAIVTQEKMAQWQDLFKSLNLSPQSIIPAPLSLPLIKDHWTIYCIDEHCFVRTDHFSGFTCEIENLSLYLQSKQDESETKPEEIDVYSLQNLPGIDKQAILFHKISEKEFLEGLWQGIQTQPSINLLQGSFKKNHSKTETKTMGLYAVYIFIAAVMIGFFNHLFSYLVLSHHASAIETRIEAIYKRNFPTATAFIAPRERMEEKLKKLTNEVGSKSFLILLGHTAKAFSESNGVRLQNLDYRDKQLNLEISSIAFENLDNFTQFLQQEGLTVTQQNAGMVNGRVKANLQLTL